MDGVQPGPLRQPRVPTPLPGESLVDHHGFRRYLLIAIGVAALVAVVVAAAMGHATMAIIIGLISSAFFARVAC
jgi:hypothetical protein